MAELKTKENDSDVETFLNQIADKQQQEDCFAILELMKNITGSQPKMWGASILGFGNYHYKYESGREGEWFITGFSPRKDNLTLYVLSSFNGYEEFLANLGKHKTGKSCLYIKKLDDVDLDILAKMIEKSVAAVREGKIQL
jgi:hypothetical protein